MCCQYDDTFGILPRANFKWRCNRKALLLKHGYEVQSWVP